MDAETVHETPPLAEDAEAAEGKPARSAKPDKSLGPLRMIWAAALVYPGRVAEAVTVSAASAVATRPG